MRNHDLSRARHHQARVKRSIFTTTLGPEHNQVPLRLPLNLPSDDDWLLKVIAIQDRLVLGLYRRQMKAISYLGKIEKKFGVAATTRNWNTIQKVAQILKDA
jgi:hypothetical protein